MFERDSIKPTLDGRAPTRGPGIHQGIWPLIAKAAMGAVMSGGGKGGKGGGKGGGFRDSTQPPAFQVNTKFNDNFGGLDWNPARTATMGAPVVQGGSVPMGGPQIPIRPPAPPVQGGLMAPPNMAPAAPPTRQAPMMPPGGGVMQQQPPQPSWMGQMPPGGGVMRPEDEEEDPVAVINFGNANDGTLFDVPLDIPGGGEDNIQIMGKVSPGERITVEPSDFTTRGADLMNRGVGAVEQGVQWGLDNTVNPLIENVVAPILGGVNDAIVEPMQQGYQGVGDRVQNAMGIGGNGAYGADQLNKANGKDDDKVKRSPTPAGSPQSYRDYTRAPDFQVNTSFAANPMAGMGLDPNNFANWRNMGQGG